MKAYGDNSTGTESPTRRDFCDYMDREEGRRLRLPLHRISISRMSTPGGQSSEYPSPTEKSASTKGLSPVIQPAPLGHPSYDQDQLFHPRSWDSDQFKSPLLYHHDFSDHSVSTTHHTNVTVNGVSDPKEAADAVASSLHDVFGRPQQVTRNLQGMMT